MAVRSFKNIINEGKNLDDLEFALPYLLKDIEKEIDQINIYLKGMQNEKLRLEKTLNEIKSYVK